jgi:hypothetical protein
LGGAILFVGLISAAIVYVAAIPAAGDPLGNGLDTSKSYVREMQVYGGTANVLATEAREWFDSLWHGKRLAMTIATFSILSSLALFWVSSRPYYARARDRRSAGPKNSS